jgi:hypothetical protein
MRNRRLAALAVAGLLAVAVAGPAAAAPRTLFLNGRPVPFTVPALERDVPLFPQKEWMEALGGTVTWRPPNLVETLLPDGRIVRIVNGSQTATIITGGKSQTVALERPVETIGNRSYIPVGNLSRALGATVKQSGNQIAVSGLGLQAEVIDGPLNVRSQPSTSASVTLLASSGTVFPVLQAGGEWHKVRLPDGGVGWVAARYTRLIKEGDAPLNLEKPGYLQLDGDCLGPVPIPVEGMYAPLRLVSERSGAKVSWDGSAHIQINGKTVTFTPGSKTAYFHGQPVQIPGAPYIVDGTMWVPIDPLSIGLDLGLTWSSDRRIVTLRSGRPAPAGAVPCAAPSVNAAAYIILDGKTGIPLAEFRADLQRPIASTTKIMTALLAVERGDLKSTVTVSANADKQIGASAYIRAGERIPLGDLLYGMMLPSGNDAATAIAEHLAGSESAFVKLMNARAKELGANNSLYLTASGLDDWSNPYATARDLGKIARQGMGRADFRAVVSTKLYTWSTHKWENSNRFLLTDPTATGVKNGWTEKAGYTVVTSAYRNGREIMVVVLGSPTRDSLYATASTLIDYGFRLLGRSYALR